MPPNETNSGDDDGDLLPRAKAMVSETKGMKRRSKTLITSRNKVKAGRAKKRERERVGDSCLMKDVNLLSGEERSRGTGLEGLNTVRPTGRVGWSRGPGLMNNSNALKISHAG